MAPNTPVTLELGDLALGLALFDEQAPMACAAVRKRLPLRGEIAMRCGPVRCAC